MAIINVIYRPQPLPGSFGAPIIRLVYPILARYGSIFIFTFTVVLALGVVVALIVTARSARNQVFTGSVDASLLLLAAAVLGGRAGFVASNWNYFSSQTAEIADLGQGGFAYHGALAAAAVALIIWSLVNGRSLSHSAGHFAPAMAIVAASAWLACYFEGCAYGRSAPAGWLAADLADEFGVFTLRYQTQLVGFFIALATVLLIWWLRSRWPPLALFAVALAGVSASRVASGFLRGDPAPTLGPWRLDLLVDSILLVGAILLLAYSLSRERPLDRQNENTNNGAATKMR